jgi:hypothetical protein
MIDHENEIFGFIYQAVMNFRNDVYVTSEKSNAPASFPCVYIEQTDSYNPRQYEQISTYKETVAKIVTTVEVYSNKPSGKRQEAKSIFAVVDDVMRRNGFRRTMQNYLDLTDINDNAVNKAVIRLLARYERLYTE